MKIRVSHLPWAFSLLLASTLPMHAQTLAQTPERALSNPSFHSGTANWDLGDTVATSSMTTVALAANEAGGARRALQIDVHSAAGLNAWDIALRQEVHVGVAAQEPLRLSFWAKADRAATVNAGIEDSVDYHKIVWSNDLELSTAWKRYEVLGKADRDFKTDSLRFIFNMAQQSAQLWLADVRLEDPEHPLTAPAIQAGPVGTLDKPLSLVPATAFAEGEGWGGNGLTIQPFDSGRPDIGRAARLTIATVPQNPWEARFAGGNPSPVNGGDAVAIRVWARSPTNNKIGLIFQQSSAPNSKILSQTVTLTPQWKEYRFVAPLDNARGFAAGGSNFEIHAGYGLGTIEIGNVRVEDFGAASRDEVIAKIGGETIDWWGGRPHDDTWRAAALERIERNRKADLRVRVVDAQGRPVNGATVTAKMTRHAFRFGTAVTSGAFWTSDSPTVQRYKEITAQNFNTITPENGMKWPAESPAQLAINENILAWAKANNIEVRGHNLVWGSTRFMPREIGGKKLADLTNEELKAGIEAHVRDYVRRYKGRVYVWDVVNEAVAERDIWERVGWDEFARVFQIAREEDPKVLLAYNDYKLFHVENDAEWRKEQEVIQKLVAAGVPLDILAEQAHLGTPLLPIPTVLSNLAELERYGKAIEVTEFDLGIRDDTVQADYVRDFLTACFSDPKVVSFVQWGFWEGAHWRATEGGHLVRRDFSFRPAMDAYRDLVFKQWWTNANGQSDATGAFGTRGFKGNYELSATKNGLTATQNIQLNEQTGVVTLTLK
ncbi:anti-sigma-I factor RsgI6 [Abditibacteriota bacterium]|nr:anti-sigma-I factor RsgI6 [Abditibacteriota bacterium]